MRRTVDGAYLQRQHEHEEISITVCEEILEERVPGSDENDCAK